MAENIFRRLSRFVEWAAEFNKGEYLFRGVKNASYIKDRKVETSSERRLPDEEKPIAPEEILEINKELMEKVRSIGHDQKDGKKLSDLNLLAELQHFGAATCLIDFTYSALIALWFACQQEQQEPGKEQENGKVVVLRSDGPEHLKKVDYDMSENKNIDYFFEIDDKGRYPRYQWQPQHQNNRIIAQQSVFVFGATVIKAEDECEIAACKKVEILKALKELSGITGERLFADFYGYAWLNAGDKPYIEPTEEAYREKGIDASQKGNTEKAIKYLTKAIELNGKYRTEAKNVDEKDLDLKNAENYRERGWVHKVARNFDKAICDLNTAICLDSESANAYNWRGIAYTAKGDSIIERNMPRQNSVITEEPFKIAEEPFKKADELFDKAICDFNTALKKNEELIKAYCNIGFAYASKGILARAHGDLKAAICHFDKAICHYTTVIEEYEDEEFDSIAYCNRGEVYVHKFEWDKAREDLKTAKQKDMDIADSFQNDYKSVELFKKINEQALKETKEKDLPEDIAEMLTKKITERTVLVEELDPSILTDNSTRLSLIITPKIEN